jgi:hypothetical protein
MISPEGSKTGEGATMRTPALYHLCIIDLAASPAAP